jgi:hypothetical protein
MSRIPRAPQRPSSAPNKTGAASNFLNRSDTQGAHNRSQHVGMSHQGLKNRITTGQASGGTATSFMSKHDQNKAAASVLGTSQANTTRSQVAGGKMHGKKAVNAPFNAPAIGARTAPIVKVAQKQTDGSIKTFNAKVTDTRMVMKKGPGGVRSQTTFATGLTPLPKPSPGPSLKPTTKANVQNIATGASGLRKVGAPAPKGPSLGDQKRFRGVTKNALPGNVKKPGQK